MRGEYLFDRHINRLIPELPPRARRIRRQAHTINPTDGTTSACAENTLRGAHAPRCRWNYLRMRGEYRGNYTNLWPLMELPPHARRIPTGKALIAENQELPPHARRIPRELHEPVATHGTTSACAENTHRQSSNRRKSGTTSACAENTCRWHPSSLGCWNYLRMRGEYCLTA